MAAGRSSSQQCLAQPGMCRFSTGQLAAASPLAEGAQGGAAGGQQSPTSRLLGCTGACTKAEPSEDVGLEGINSINSQ